ncbi:MAG: tetratricopeptide repeat protein [Gomphosphaeria aponina SAG 52.96 = DSM 107014]|uniref:Tetratricopeptide repeat protein n=1 Tax=Gomphosphaeria aponina SAG 52.96 = DSM 107014 TaxID=1521640 RepID=A0A941GP69_9CHRO|nr:tetratricopeptide repeat protein [Gomphosphaeria aponina SAG 52.96 = DSM 107014]
MDKEDSMLGNNAQEKSAADYLSLGYEQEIMGDYEKALQYYQKAIQLNPQQPTWVFASLANLLLQQAKFDGAQAAYLNLIALQPDNADAYRGLAQCKTSLGDHTGAIQSYQKAMELNPQQPVWVFTSLGNLLLLEGKIDEAEAAYKAAIKLHSDNADAYRGLAQCQTYQGNNLAALKNYQKAIELNSQQPVWVFTSLGSLLFQQKHYLEALNVYHEALKLQADNEAAYRGLAQCQTQQGDYAAAIESYQKTIELNPQQPVWVFTSLGNLFFQQHEMDEALNAYNQAIKLYPNAPEVYQQKGEFFEQNGELEQAIACYRRSLAIKPQSYLAEKLALLSQWQETQQQRPLILENLPIAIPKLPQEPNNADAFREKGDLEAAVESYRTELKLNPNLIEGYIGLGEVLVELGKLEEAIVCYQQGLEINPKSPEIYAHLGNAQQQLGKGYLQAAMESYEQAIALQPDYLQVYHQALAIKPDAPEIYLQLGDALARKKLLTQALFFYQTAFMVQPKNAAISFKIGQVLDRQGYWEEAMEYYTHAVENHPQEPEYNYHLGRMLEKQQKLEEAKYYYQQATILDNQSELYYSALGDICLKNDAWLSAAVTAYNRAREINPNSANLDQKLGEVFVKLGKAVKS